jgi:hypothetical protein
MKLNNISAQSLTYIQRKTSFSHLPQAFHSLDFCGQKVQNNFLLDKYVSENIFQFYGFIWEFDQISQ